MKKRLLSALLGLSLLLPAAGALPASAAELPPETAWITDRLSEAETVWADGAPYVDRFEDGCSLCFGFIRELYAYLFEAQLPTMWDPPTATFLNYPERVELVAHVERYTDAEVRAILAQAQPGDVLIASNGRTSHGVIVRSVMADGSGVSIYDANWTKNANGQPLLRANGWWSAEELLQHRPQAISLYRNPDIYRMQTASGPEIIALQTEQEASALPETEQESFRDVDPQSWYAPYVQSVYRLGLMQGDADRRFLPSNTLTVLQALILAVRVHSLYRSGSAELPAAEAELWYQPYLDYALREGILSGVSGDVNRTATRTEVAELFARALPAEGRYPTNAIADGAIPDVPMSAAGAEEIYSLYRAGILTGGNQGLFSPEQPVSRAEAAAIIARMADSSVRVRFSL